MQTQLLSLSRTLLLSVVVLMFSHAPVYGQQDQTAEPVRNIQEWDLNKKKLAIDGYDPVAYFSEGGGKATKGSKKIETAYKGVTYRFASEKNRTLFMQSPTKYEPAHGGWCSWAMKSGEKTASNPKSFIVQDGRLFLFYKGLLGDTRKSWRKDDHDKQAVIADDSWKTVSGESPRLNDETDDG